MAGNTKKKGLKAGIIFWLIFAVIILIAFFIARGKISNVLNETGFFKEVLGENPEFISGLLQQDSKKSDTVIDIVPQKDTMSPIDLNTSVAPQTEDKPVTEAKETSPVTAAPIVQKESDLTLPKTEKKETQQTAAAKTEPAPGPLPASSVPIMYLQPASFFPSNKNKLFFDFIKC